MPPAGFRVTVEWFPYESNHTGTEAEVLNEAYKRLSMRNHFTHSLNNDIHKVYQGERPPNQIFEYNNVTFSDEEQTLYDVILNKHREDLIGKDLLANFNQHKDLLGEWE